MLSSQVTDFLSHLRFVKRYSAHTQAAYAQDLRQFSDYLAAAYGEDFCAAGAKEIRHFHIRSWLAEMQQGRPLAATTRNRKVSSLNSFFRFLLQRGVVAQNPTRLLHAIKAPERLPQFLKPEETEQLLEEHAFGEGWDGLNHRIICELLYAAGLRRAELIGLKDADLESDGRLRVLGKGSKERLVPLGPAVLRALREYQTEKRKAGMAAGPLLVLEDGKPLYPGYEYRAVRRHLSGVSTLKKQSPHILRHTFATHLLNNGANIQSIKELLGHASLAATQIYTHNSIDLLKDIHRKHHPRA